MKDLKQKAKNGIIWSSIERFSAQGVQFVLGIILARLLSPNDFGLLGMLGVFLSIAQCFIDSGFSSALVQKKNRDEIDYTTVFYFNIIISILAYSILYVTAPLISIFYNQVILIDLTRAIGLVIIISSFTVVQRARLTIKIDFKTQTKASISSIIISGLIGIYMAYSGFGVWALVWQALIRAFINTIVLWFYSKWMPKEKFSIVRFKSLSKYGSKLLASSLIDTVFRNIYTVVIGKIYTAQSLGYYTRADQFANFPSSNITGVIQSVTFPILSELQDNDEKLINAYKKIIRMSASVVFPLMIGLVALSEPIVTVLLTDKWSEVIWMLQILCLALMWYPIHAINLNILNVKGRSDLFLKLEIYKKVLLVLIILISYPFGMKVMIWGQVAFSLLALIINTHYTKKIINYGFINQAKDLYGVLILSLSMGIVVYAASSLFSNNFIKIGVGSFSALFIYVPIAFKFNISEFKELKTFIKK